jgi:hypothetical protein
MFDACFRCLLFCATVAGPSFAQTTEIQYLSGTDKDHTVSWQFILTGSGRNVGVQTNIPVPSCWETVGFGNYQYGSGSSSNGETGAYTFTFPVTNAWAGKRIFLVFEGVFTDASASINGQSIGPTHQGGFYEFKYDVTTNVVVGASTNVLQVTVKKWSSSTNIINAEQLGDYWDFGGIYRPVYLEAKPAACVERLAANPQASGQITVNAFLGGISNSYTVNAFVTGTNGVQLGGAFSAPISAGATNVVLSTSIPSPDLWSAEFPNLYTLTVQLLDTNSLIVHAVTNLIGFRTVTFTNNLGFFINGKKVVFRGICRHEQWPTTGRATSRALSASDIGLMKDMNLNAARMSHYPPNKVFLEECDRLGLYILDELDSYQHGGNALDIANGARLIYELVRRDVNHPSVIIWDNGNEGGANANLDGGNAGSTNYFALYDPQNRKVIRPVNFNDSFGNIFTWHYLPFNNSANPSQTFTNLLGAGKTVYMPTEILHAMYDGGGGASLQEYWDAMRSAPNGGGMFLWSFDDEGIVRDDLAGALDVQGQSAPDGVVGPYREKEASFYACKAIFNPVQVGAPALPSFSATLPISNRFDFTSLSQCSFDWQVGWFPDPTDPTNLFAPGFIIGLGSGPFPGPSIAPGSTGSLPLPSFPSAWTNYDALRLSALDPFGNNLYTWTWPLRSPSQIRDRLLGRASAFAPALVAGTNGSEIIVTNGPRIFHFSKTSGLLNSLTVSNQPVSFGNGPRPVAGAAWPVATVTNYFDGANYVILMNNLATSSNAFQWNVRPDGWLTLTYRYTNTGPQNWLGITFDYPSNKTTSMTWLGQGPFRIWKNRTAGQELFVHVKAANNTWTGHQWAYPEFPGYHGQLYWANLSTTEQPITLATSTSNLFFRVLTPVLNDRSQLNPPFPTGSLSLLHAINAIGNKFDYPTNTGPAGATNLATGLYAGEASFFFGPLPASGADRDGDQLVDAWELKYFGALGHDPRSDSNQDGVPLFLENVFDLSPTTADPDAGRLPRAVVPGLASPVALAYRVPVPQLDLFNLLPQISPDLFQWYGADVHPEYFLVTTTPNGSQTSFSFEPNLAAWPGSSNQLFLRLLIFKKN